MADGARDRHGLAFPFEAPPAEAEAVAVADGVLWLRLPLPMAGLDHVNLYALEDGPGWTLVDTGMGWERGRAAMEAALSGPLAGRPVTRVILTHHHPDHIGLAGMFAARGAEIWASRVAWLTGRMLTLDVQDRPTPEQIAFRRRAGVTGPALDAYAAERPFNFADMVDPIPLGYRAVGEGDRIRIGGRDWTARLGEGHAPAQVTLWSEDGLMLAGDQVIAGISPNVGVYPTEPQADPLAGWLESCRRFRALTETGADPLVLPGHKLPFRGLGARLDHLIENHEHALARIEAALAEAPATAAGLFHAIYRREIRPHETGLALVEAVAHLNHLAVLGRIAAHEGPEGALLWQPAPPPRPTPRHD